MRWAGADNLEIYTLNDITSIIRVKVQNKHSDILLDSGANISVVDYAYVKDIGVQIEPVPVGTL